MEAWRARVARGGFRTAGRDLRPNRILEGLPGVIHLPGEHGRGPAWLESSLPLLLEEAFSEAPGSSTVARRVADIMFVQAIRGFLSSNPISGGGWLRDLTDPQVSKALARVHSAPEVALTLEGLAREVGLSLLGSADLSLAETAARVGYDSEVAFSKAFKRWSGEAPGRYRSRARASS